MRGSRLFQMVYSTSRSLSRFKLSLTAIQISPALLHVHQALAGDEGARIGDDFAGIGMFALPLNYAEISGVDILLVRQVAFHEQLLITEKGEEDIRTNIHDLGGLLNGLCIDGLRYSIVKGSFGSLLQKLRLRFIRSVSLFDDQHGEVAAGKGRR